MVKIKEMARDLTGLLNENPAFSGGGFGSSFNSDDSIPNELQDIEPVFEINFKSQKKQAYKKAKEQVKLIVKEIIPEQFANTSMIKDKIEQDSEQLGNLYYMWETKDIAYQALLTTIGKGRTEARMFEVLGRSATALEDLSKRITETQNQFRKYYIDTYLDLQNKIENDEISHSNMVANIEDKKEAKTNESEVLGIPQKNEDGKSFFGTDQTIDFLKKQQIEKFKKKQQAIIANEVKE